MHNTSNISGRDRLLKRQEPQNSIKVFSILAQKSRRNSPVTYTSHTSSLIGSQNHTPLQNMSSRVGYQNEATLLEKSREGFQSRKEQQEFTRVSHFNEYSSYMKILIAQRKAEENVSPTSTHHNVANDHAYVSTNNWMKTGLRGQHPLNSEGYHSSKFIPKSRPSASAMTTPKHSKPKETASSKENAKFSYVGKRGPKLSSKHIHQNSLIGNFYHHKDGKYGQQVAYSLQHSRANSNEFERELDTSGLKIKQAAQPRFKLKYYQAQSRQRSPDQSTPDIYPTSGGEEDLTKYQKAKIVSEMSALQELKKKLYGLKRNSKFQNEEVTPNLQSSYKYARIQQKNPVQKEGINSSQVTPRCYTPISQKASLSKLNKRLALNCTLHSAQNSPQLFQRNYSNFMDLSARMERPAPHHEKNKSAFHMCNNSGRSEVKSEWNSQNPSYQASPVANLRYGSRSPSTKIQHRQSVNKFFNNHNLMPAPQFLSKAREDALARQKMKENSLGISQFLNTNFLRSPQNDKSKQETSNSPTTRATKLSNLISFLKNLDRRDNSESISPKGSTILNSDGESERVQSKQSQKNIAILPSKSRAFQFYPSASEVSARNSGITDQRTRANTSTNKISLRDYLTNSNADKREGDMQSSNQNDKSESQIITSLNYEEEQNHKEESSAQSRNQLAKKNSEPAGGQQIYRLNAAKGGPLNVSINNNITNIHISHVNLTPQKSAHSRNKKEEYNIRSRRGVSLDQAPQDNIPQSLQGNNASSARCSPRVLYSRNLPQQSQHRRDSSITVKAFPISEESVKYTEPKKEDQEKEKTTEPKYSIIHSKSRKNMPSLEPANKAPLKNLYPIMQEQSIASSNVSRMSNNGGQENEKERGKSSHFEFQENGLMEEREKLIKFIKLYIAKHKELPPTTLDYYKITKLIGKGAFGKVTLATHKLTGKLVAIKTIDKSYMKDDFSRRKVMQEVYILKKIRHPNVIRLLEVFESPKHFLMVMEYASEGDLLQYVKKKRRLSEPVAKFIFKQIVYGLAHIHSRSVLHRDIKLDNILIDSNNVIKICDFGVSKIIRRGAVINEQCGTPAYIAPQIIADDGYEGFFVDIWSLGVLLFAMLCGTVPFKAPNMHELHRLIMKGDFEFPIPISISAQKLIKGMLQIDPTHRLTFSQLLASPWLADCAYGQGLQQDFQMSLKGQLLMQNKINNFTRNKNTGGGNINFLDIQNLFYCGNYSIKLTGADYYNIFQGEQTDQIDEEALKVAQSLGYPRQIVLKSVKKGDITHATSTYYLLTH